MTTSTAPEVDAELLQEGDWVHFFVTTSIMRDGLMFSTPIITRYGSELQLTAEILESYNYPKQESWLTRLGQADRNGTVTASRGRWPDGQLRSQPGSPEREEEHHQALEAIWETYGPEYSADKANAIKELERIYGERRDSWSAQNDAWKQARLSEARR